MGLTRPSRACNDRKICAEVFVGFILIWAATNSFAATNPVDVAAINRLFAALGFPQLPGWVQSGGDPCLEAWQGVQCNASDIITIILNGANLGGELGDSLGDFASITVLDLSNNHIGGSIPPNLPVTLKILFLSANQFSGSIPSSIATLTLLTDMSLNNNLLSGEIPDAFESLTGLINLDLSTNNLSGQLPPTLENLSLLTTLHLQDNQLFGTLDVLQDLPLKDLNIENNLFSGTIPDKMLQGITNFRKDGNPCNTPPTSVVTPPPPPSQSQHRPGKQDGPSACDESNSGRKKFLTTKEVGRISIAGGVSFLILASVVGMAIGRVWPRIFGPGPTVRPGPTVGPEPEIGPEKKFKCLVKIMLEPDPKSGTGTGIETGTGTKTETGTICGPLREIISDIGSRSLSPDFSPALSPDFSPSLSPDLLSPDLSPRQDMVYSEFLIPKPNSFFVAATLRFSGSQTLPQTATLKFSAPPFAYRQLHSLSPAHLFNTLFSISLVIAHVSLSEI